MKSVKLLLTLICSALLLAGCGGISESDAIKLAKQAAANLPSPPRLYGGYVTDAAHNDTSMLRYWPDTPATKAGQFSSCGNPPANYSEGDCTSPMTMTTAVTSDSSGDGMLVSFTIGWQFSGNHQHSWLFHVNNDGKADFIKEEGDQLPQMPR